MANGDNANILSALLDPAAREQIGEVLGDLGKDIGSGAKKVGKAAADISPINLLGKLRHVKENRGF